MGSSTTILWHGNCSAFESLPCNAKAKEVVHDTRRTHRETARHQTRKGLDLEIYLRRDRRHVAGADYRGHPRSNETHQAAVGEGRRTIRARQKRAGVAQRGTQSRLA